MSRIISGKEILLMLTPEALIAVVSWFFCREAKVNTVAIKRDIGKE